VKTGPSAAISESYVMTTAAFRDPTEDVCEHDDRTSRFRKNKLCLDHSLKHSGKCTMCFKIMELCIFYTQCLCFLTFSEQTADYLPKQD
jgi:hypothetical protein